MSILLFVLAQAAAAPLPEPAPLPPNVLLVIADDLGTDKVGAYGEHPRAPRTPRIDALAAEGILFRNAYANPLCSATRAALLTGRYVRRTGIGAVIPWEGTWELPLDEVTLPELLDRGRSDYATAAIGKWHLSGPSTRSSVRHPNLQGFDHYSGAISNLYFGAPPGPTDYFHYDKVVDGVSSRVHEYATSATTDDALDALAAMPEPWLLHVAYHAVHTPIHVPPGADLPEGASVTAMHDAMVEQLDREIGRLLDGIPPDQREHTLIVFLGDNGTSAGGVLPPRDPAQTKPTVYEGGTNVPLIVAGPGVTRHGAVADALVHVVDVLPTLAALAGVDPALTGKALDGVSFAEVLADPECSGARRFVYTERFYPPGGGPRRLECRAVRDERYKLIDNDGAVSFHDLGGRSDDGPARPLDQLTPAERIHLAALQSELERIEREASFEY